MELKKFVSILLSGLLLTSPSYAAVKKGATEFESVTVNGDTKLNGNVATDNARIEFVSDVNFTGATTGVTAGAAIADWASGVVYGLNQLVTYGDNLYRANTAHTSGASFGGDTAYWDVMSQFVEANKSPAMAGFIQAHAGTSAPTGWALANGDPISSVTYPELYTNIGNTWGDGGDGAGPLFNLPDLVTGNRFPRAAGGSLSVGDTQADATAVNNLTNGLVPTHGFGTGNFQGTVNKNQWNTDQIAHRHTLYANADASDAPFNSHRGNAGTDYNVMSGTLMATAIATWNSVNAYAYITKSNFDHSHTAPTQLSTDTETRPNSAVVNYIVKLHNDQPGNVVSIPAEKVFNVGDVKQSILTEAQFQSIHGTNWVKIRGQSITGSKLCVDFSVCTLPAAEGRFLRDSVSNVNLGLPVDDTTAKNGLGNATSSVTGVTGTNTSSGTFVNKNLWNINQTSHSHSDGTFAAAGGGAHSHGFGGGGAFLGTTGGDGTFGAFGGGSSIYYSNGVISAPDHTHDVTGASGSASASWASANAVGTASAQSWSQSGTGSAAAQVISGDDETAPDHLIVNTFIKIN